MRENGIGKKRRMSDQRSYNPGFLDVEPRHMMELHVQYACLYNKEIGDSTEDSYAFFDGYENESSTRYVRVSPNHCSAGTPRLSASFITPRHHPSILDSPIAFACLVPGPDHGNCVSKLAFCSLEAAHL